MERLRRLEQEISLLKSKLGHKPPEKPLPLRSAISEVKPVESNVLLPSVDLGNIRVIQILMDWVGFILSKAGKEKFNDIVDYYVSIHWISEEVGELLKAYARGMEVEGEGIMLPEDHLKSLEFISRIKEEMT